jgi:Skp family chaperone for outer membrane proteins
MKKFIIFISILFAFPVFAQKTGFVSSELIRQKFPDAQQSEQRIQSIVDSWKREVEAMQKKIESLEFEIKKNRLIWTDQERIDKENELEKTKKIKQDFLNSKYEPGGEYDKTVQAIMQPIETKIYAIIQEVSSEEGYDIVIDQSTTTMPYVNFKYDLTVKVLKKMGVDVEVLEKEQKEKIDKDPRNQKQETKVPTGTRKVNRNDPNKKIDKDKELEKEKKPEEKKETEEKKQ